MKDGDREWETFHDLRTRPWAQGMAGTELTVTVRRHGNLFTMMWAVENTYSELKQLGFQITEPVQELA